MDRRLELQSKLSLAEPLINDKTLLIVTQWNMATFAEQGYVVVLPNIAGSTGFGNDFVKSE